MTDMPEDPQAADRREAVRWATAGDTLNIAATQAAGAANLLADNGVAAAFDTVRPPSPSADTNIAELRSISSRLAAAAQECRDRAAAITARLNPEEP